VAEEAKAEPAEVEVADVRNEYSMDNDTDDSTVKDWTALTAARNSLSAR
jgi:hypothetical protein